jgi:predicted ATP-dependent endonuclease of OLD family
MEKKSYKLIGLQIEGIRLIKACYLKFKPNGLTEIIGKNNAGKSSVIDAIEILLKGFKYKQDDIITHELDKARIIGEFGDFTVSRLMGKSDRLEVLTKDGFKPGKPQDFLDSLINQLTFRPQIFLAKKPEEKLKAVMDILKIDFTKENQDIATKTNERLFCGRERDNLGTKIEPEKVEFVDTADLLVQKQKIETINVVQKQKQDDIDYFNTMLTSASVALGNVVNKAAIGDNSLSGRKAGLAKIVDTIEKIIEKMPLPDYQKTDDIDLKISTASETNKKAQAYKDYNEWKVKKDAKVAEYDKLTKDINDLKAKKITKLKETEMPVKGLEIKEITEGVYGLFHNGIYCENWSSSVGLKISLAICAAMAPDLRAIAIDQGEALDEDSRKALDAWSIQNNIQVIITVVQKIPEELADGTFYIESGRLFNSEGDCLPKEEQLPGIPEEESEPIRKPKIDTNTLF